MTLMREWSTSYTSPEIKWLRLSDGAGVGLNSERRSRRNTLMLLNYHWGLTGLEEPSAMAMNKEQ